MKKTIKPKGFGYTDEEVLEDITLSDITSVEDWEYVAHPKTLDEYTELKREIEGYIRPNYKSASYVYTDIVKVAHFKLRKNVGRKKGNDNKVYSIIEKNFERGYKRGKLPPVVLKDINGTIYDWLVNGNHRWLWYCKNGYIYIIVDVYEPKEGFDEEDVIDEIGLLHQPQPDGTSSSREDYVIRGQRWVERRTEAKLKTHQKDVNKWVDKFAKHECSRFRTDLKKSIFNKSCKSKFLTNYNRTQIKNFYKEKENITILDSDAKIKGDKVYRLFEASQNVLIRDFLPTFLEDAANKITTVLNLWVNTSNKEVEDAESIQKCINKRLSELDDILNDLDTVSQVDEDGEEDLSVEGTGIKLRKYLVYGSRPPQICGIDDYEGSVEYEVPDFDNEDFGKEKRMYNMTLEILKGKFEDGVPFSIDEADNVVYPIRINVSSFKNRKSFRGTLLAELQKLRDLNQLEFVKGKKGHYRLI